MRVRLPELGLHLVRLSASAAALAIADRLASLPLCVGASAALFFETFALTHDVAHGALRLPRRVNEAALLLAGLVMFTSGHAMRTMHLEHHRKHLGDGDLEGTPARYRLWQAALLAPLHAVALRVAAMRRARGIGRRWQAMENVTSAALFAACLTSGHGSLVAYALVVSGMQLSAAVWASHVPHNTPAWLLALARRFAFTRSPTVLSLAFHDAHHAHPTLPCQRLPEVA